MPGGIWNCGVPTTTQDFDFYRNALNDNCPLLVHLAANSNFGTAGHAVFNFGHAKSTSGTNYLFVMDGF